MCPGGGICGLDAQEYASDLMAIERARTTASTSTRPSNPSFSRFAHKHWCRGNLLCIRCQCVPFQRKVISCHLIHVLSIRAYTDSIIHEQIVNN
jgi:hypothetical protein